jgi:hypothetical protein
MTTEIRDYSEERLIGMPMPRWSSRVSRCHGCGRLGVESAWVTADGLTLTIHRERLSASAPHQVVEACATDRAGIVRSGSFVLRD